MIPDDIRARLAKLKALADRGVGGEAVAARAQYDKLLARIGLSAEALDAALAADAATPRLVTPGNRYERSLLHQIIGYVTGAGTIKYSRRGKQEEHLLTDAQYHRVTVLYAQHKPALAAHLKRAFSAYIHANGLVAPADSEGSGVTHPDPDWAAIRQMMRGVDALPDLTRLTLPEGADQ